ALVLVAKAVVAAIVSGVYTALMVIASIIVALMLAATFGGGELSVVHVSRVCAEPFVGVELSLSQASSWRAAGAISLYAALAAVLGVGVGALVRHAAAAVAVLLLWPLLLA